MQEKEALIFCQTNISINQCTLVLTLKREAYDCHPLLGQMRLTASGL
jgi:hypothetical protein